MFLTFARLYESRQGADLHTIQQIPAAQLSRWLDEVWYQQLPTAGVVPVSTVPTASTAPAGFDATINAARRSLGHPQSGVGTTPISPSGVDVPTTTPFTAPGVFTDERGPVFLPPTGHVVWAHLIYAYLVESTGAFDIFAEVARRLVLGESLGTLGLPSIVWLRNTEELFFRDPPLFSVAGVVSDLRPSASSNRRNAYWRLFGMDLPHQPPPGWPGTPTADAWKQNTAPGVNTEFQEKLLELLRQVWLGLVNANNATGANPADNGYIALLCETLKDMMLNRRKQGLLAREELVYVSFLSWFHLTLLGSGSNTNNQDSPIIRDLQAQGTSPEQRLNNLATKVGMKPAPRARELFQIAERMSLLLRSIELGLYDTASDAELLYTEPAIAQDIRVIINNWQSATGQRIKDQDAVSRTQSLQPFRVPTPTPAMSTNGKGVRS